MSTTTTATATITSTKTLSEPQSQHVEHKLYPNSYLNNTDIVYDDSLPVWSQLSQFSTLLYVLLATYVASLYYYNGIFAILKYAVLPYLGYHLFFYQSGSALKMAARILEQSRVLAPRINWLHVVFLFIAPIIGFTGAYYTKLTTKTMVWALFYYIFSGLGITAGYHRLFAHRAYEAHPIINFLMMVMGTAALEGSAKWWCGGHRVHHRYTDTEFDPYDASKGFLYSHIGWMLIHPLPQGKKKADISDLNASPMLRWQHKNYLWFGPLCAVGIPTLVAGLGWGDWAGGLFYAGLIRLFFVHHATFCVNSVAHFLGEQTFDDNRSPRDHIITAFLTFGEGYHNFHHEFPNDYRNGIRFFDYDPTKWVIKTLNLLGLAWKLRVFPTNEIQKGKVLMKEKHLGEEKAKIYYAPSIESLPPMTLTAFTEESKRWIEDNKKFFNSTTTTTTSPKESSSQIKTVTTNEHPRALVAIDGAVHDISYFISRHPGGDAYIRSAIGTVANARFRGDTGIYAHSQAARHLLSNYRVAKLVLTEEERIIIEDRERKQVERCS
jgi:stearoyl-CoA desaturase (delta-9 desaturase)